MISLKKKPPNTTQTTFREERHGVQAVHTLFPEGKGLRPAQPGPICVPVSTRSARFLLQPGRRADPLVHPGASSLQAGLCPARCLPGDPGSGAHTQRPPAESPSMDQCLWLEAWSTLGASFVSSSTSGTVVKLQVKKTAPLVGTSSDHRFNQRRSRVLLRDGGVNYRSQLWLPRNVINSMQMSKGRFLFHPLATLLLSFP